MKALVALFGFSLATCMLFKSYHHLTINQTGDLVLGVLGLVLIYISSRVIVADYREFKERVRNELENDRENNES